ncbi:MAG: ferredoxin [Patescibacteria group bacterium]|nr:ferredoxin [Patescibacteria group bacterium]MDD4611056.1 ferredoxin [Patescibacteria group bacterium]
MIKVDQKKCVGCGRCTEICPGTFKLNASGKSEVVEQKNTDCAMKAADNCPVEAIHVDE